MGYARLPAQYQEAHLTHFQVIVQWCIVQLLAFVIVGYHIIILCCRLAEYPYVSRRIYYTRLLGVNLGSLLDAQQ